MSYFIRVMLSAALVAAGFAAHARLYAIREGDRWGFIDSTGRVVVPTIYRNVQPFHEGLAAVRKEGTYGYIDEQGRVAVPFRFDWAGPFDGGLAIAYRGGRPYVINRFGEVIFDHSFVRISRSGVVGLWKVGTADGQDGVANNAGQLVIDTMYDRMGHFVDGRAVVYHRPKSKPGKPNHDQQAAIMDTTGRLLIPFGDYENIGYIEGGYFFAYLRRNSSSEKLHTTEILNHDGKVVTQADGPGWYIAAGDFQAGSTPVAIRKQRTKQDSIDYNYPGSYYGVMDSTGKVLFSDTSWCALTPFSAKRAFAGYDPEGRGVPDKWMMIDRAGSRIGADDYDEVYREYDEQGGGFADGVAFVRRGKAWMAIDTMGRQLFPSIDLDSATEGSKVHIYKRMGRVLLLTGNIGNAYNDDENSPGYKYGMWDTRNNTFLPFGWNHITPDTSANGLHTVVSRDGRLAIITSNRLQVWREPFTESNRRPLHIDHMNRGYFYASGPARVDLAGFGGWGNSDNAPSSAPGGSAQTLQLTISDEPANWRKEYTGKNVYLRNGTQDTIYFNAQDSRLYMKVEALDERGAWRDIEYLPSSWCGNSYHKVALPPRHAWSFVAPDYEGSFKTKLRISVLYLNSPDGRKDAALTLYSNEVSGSVNPGQFWRKQDYSPGGLMDPYED